MSSHLSCTGGINYLLTICFCPSGLSNSCLRTHLCTRTLVAFCIKQLSNTESVTDMDHFYNKGTNYESLEKRWKTEKLERIANIYNLTFSNKRYVTMAFKGKFPLRSKMYEKMTETFSNFKYMGWKISVLIARQDINNKLQKFKNICMEG
jgi:hypothetical protein